MSIFLINQYELLNFVKTDGIFFKKERYAALDKEKLCLYTDKFHFTQKKKPRKTYILSEFEFTANKEVLFVSKLNQNKLELVKRIHFPDNKLCLKWLETIKNIKSYNLKLLNDQKIEENNTHTIIKSSIYSRRIESQPNLNNNQYKITNQSSDNNEFNPTMPHKMDFRNSLSINPITEEKHPNTHFSIHHEEDFSFNQSNQQKKLSPVKNVQNDTKEISIIKVEESYKLPSVDQSFEKAIIQNFPKNTMGNYLRDMKNEAKNIIDSYTSSVKLYDIGSNSNEKIIFKSTKKNRHSSNKENNNSEIKMINSIVQYNNIISKRNLENLTRNLEKEFQQVEKGKTALEDNLLKESTQDNIKLNTSSNKSDTTIYYSTLIENMIKNCYSQDYLNILISEDRKESGLCQKIDNCLKTITTMVKNSIKLINRIVTKLPKLLYEAINNLFLDAYNNDNKYLKYMNYFIHDIETLKTIIAEAIKSTKLITLEVQEIVDLESHEKMFNVEMNSLKAFINLNITLN